MIIQALKIKGNITKAAEMLNITTFILQIGQI